MFCNALIEDESEEIPYKKRYAHKNCFNSYLHATTTVAKEKQEKKHKPTKNVTTTNAIKKPVSEEEYQHKQEYLNLVKELLGTDEIPVQIFALTNNYMERYGLSYEDMSIALDYWYKIKGNTYQEGNLIGIVPYIVSDAKKFFQGLENTIKANTEMDTDGFYSKRVVHIEKPKGKENTLIDIANI